MNEIETKAQENFHTNLLELIKLNSYGNNEIQFDNSWIEISGSEEGASKMEIIVTKIDFEVNFDKIFENSYQKCLNDPFCSFEIGGTASIINFLSSNFLKDGSDMTQVE